LSCQALHTGSQTGVCFSLIPMTVAWNLDRTVKLYRDRKEAGEVLAHELESYRGHDPLVLGLPRGGVIPAAEVARALGADLDVLSVAKIGAPGNREFAIGAVSEGGELYLDSACRSITGITEAWVEEEKTRALAMMRERLAAYRAVKDMMPMRGRNVIIVDDGLATGATMTCAVYAARASGAVAITAAVPVGSDEAVRRVGALKETREVVCPLVPEVFFSVSQFYIDFHEVGVEEVCKVLREGVWP